MNRLYIFGPSGSGTTTLASRLSAELGVYHLDTDDYYWQKTCPPYKETVPVNARIVAIQNELQGKDEWIVSGCMCSWGAPILQQTTHAVYLWIPWAIRQMRLRAREEKRFGKGCLLPDGSRYVHFQEFEDWAQAYDTADASMRSRKRHDAWIRQYEESGKPVLRLEQDESVEQRVGQVIPWFSLKIE